MKFIRFPQGNECTYYPLSQVRKVEFGNGQMSIYFKGKERISAHVINMQDSEKSWSEFLTSKEAAFFSIDAGLVRYL